STHFLRCSSSALGEYPKPESELIPCPRTSYREDHESHGIRPSANIDQICTVFGDWRSWVWWSFTSSETVVFPAVSISFCRFRASCSPPCCCEKPLRTPGESISWRILVGFSVVSLRPLPS